MHAQVQALKTKMLMDRTAPGTPNPLIGRIMPLALRSVSEGANIATVTAI